MVGGAVPEGGIGTLVPSTPISIVVCRAVIYFPQHRPFNYMTLGDQMNILLMWLPLVFVLSQCYEANTQAIWS